MKYKLKKSVEIGGKSYEIRTEYSVILEIIEMMDDVELDNAEKAIASLIMFYPNYDTIPQEYWGEAIEKCYWFIGGCKSEEEQSKKKSPRLVDWQKDFSKIVSAVNRVLGYDVRSVEYDFETNTGGVSWETFMSAFQEIGDCYFAQIVRIRDKKARGKKLDKTDQEFYRKNAADIDIKQKYTKEEEEQIKRILGLT